MTKQANGRIYHIQFSLSEEVSASFRLLLGNGFTLKGCGVAGIIRAIYWARPRSIWESTTDMAPKEQDHLIVSMRGGKPNDYGLRKAYLVSWIASELGWHIERGGDALVTVLPSDPEWDKVGHRLIWSEVH